MSKYKPTKSLSRAWVSAAVFVTALFAWNLQAAENLKVPADALAQIAANKGAATYIVRMSDDPVVAYDGGIAGLAATKPQKGKKINPRSAKVEKYVEYLSGRHNQALAAVGGSKVYGYYYSLNGFAARLTPSQARDLAAMPDVVAVEKDVLMQLDTSRTPDFLGLTDPGGLWEQLGGHEQAGEGVIVGIIDSGIWPENRSFSDRNENGKLVFQQIPGWNGRCVPGEDFPASDCNQKMIAAQWYNAGWGGNAGVKSLFPYEFASARDADGHGSHTASTAAGNYGVPVEVGGNDLGTISGMAPRARISAYKVCWGVNEGGCFGSDSVAAIDQAVADGVDVLNFSISGTRTNYLDAVEVAFLFAADAGVFVAASAGNSGPGAGTVAHMSPWLTTVAAGTKDDFYEGSVVLGNGAVYTGASRATPVGPESLVYSADVGLAGADPNQVRLCYPGTLDPAAVAGNIVACDRGVIARVDKSLAVAMAGGIGSILMNTSPSSLNADLHSVPTVHVDHLARPAILAYIASEGADATASLSGNVLTVVEAPFVASFSSRGPNQAGGDLLKPDIMAPGVDILAAVSPIGYNGDNWNFLSGTSMSSPHVAGLGALLTHAHPDWSPMMIKSALMTSATTETNDGNPIPGGPFAYGAGHVVPNSAVDPGLVYDAGFIDWLGFLCGTGQLNAGYCPAIGIDPSDLNYPSIAIADLAGVQTVTRTVTNVGPAGTYHVSVDPPAGIDVVVSPATLDLDTGESASYEVTFTTTEAATTGAYAFGSLTWSHGPHNVTSPLVVRPVQLAAPDELGAEGTDGSLSFDVTFGYSGDYTAAAHGLVPATMTSGNVEDDPGNSFSPFGPGTTLHMVSVPAGSAFARFSLFDDYTDGDDDLDLYVYYPWGAFAGGSGSGTSAEQVNIVSPPAGDYYVFVHGWQTDGPDANYTLFDWSVSATPGGSLTVDSAPASAVLGTTGTIDVSWAGLGVDMKYLGAVSHSDGGGVFGLTLIGVETD